MREIGAVGRRLLEGVADRLGGDGAGVGVEGVDQIADEGGGEERAGGIVDQHAIRRMPAQRLDAGQHGGLARCAPGHRGQ